MQAFLLQAAELQKEREAEKCSLLASLEEERAKVATGELRQTEMAASHEVNLLIRMSFNQNKIYRIDKTVVHNERYILYTGTGPHCRLNHRVKLIDFNKCVRCCFVAFISITALHREI